jgi:hypothetical protein
LKLASDVDESSSHYDKSCIDFSDIGAWYWQR